MVRPQCGLPKHDKCPMVKQGEGERWRHTQGLSVPPLSSVHLKLTLALLRRREETPWTLTDMSWSSDVHEIPTSDPGDAYLYSSICLWQAHTLGPSFCPRAPVF